MIVKLFDNTELTVNTEQASRITKAMSKGTKALIINGMTVNTSAIATIRPGGYSEADVITDKSKLLERPDHRGKPSPNKEKIRKWIKPPQH